MQGVIWRLTWGVLIGTFQGMEHHIILTELDEYARDAGVDVSTVCRKATGNPRLRDRLVNRLARLEKDVDRLREYMASNPPVKRDGSLACPENIGPALIKRKGATQ